MADTIEVLTNDLTKARRARDAEEWCYGSAAAVFKSKPYERNYLDLKACAERLLEATAACDRCQDAIEREQSARLVNIIR